MTAVVIRADARTLPLADASVDLIVTSPPYFALRSYQDGGEHYDGQVGAEANPAEFVEALIACTREWARVLKPSGSLWVNLGDSYSGGNRGVYDRTDINGARGGGRRPTTREHGIRGKSLMGIPWRYALRCIDDLGLILRAEVIWSKPNGLPESVTDRVRRSHEQWFHFTMQQRYFSAVDEVREPHIGGGKGMTWADRLADPNAPKSGWREKNGTMKGGTFAGNALGKLPGSVWTIPTEPLQAPGDLGVDHFAAFPTEWPRRIIQGWSPDTGVVLDPFGGTGTTALVASALGRVGVSVDLSHDYSRLAAWRTTDRGQIAKAMRVDKPPVEAAGQADLFDVVA